MSGPSSDSGSKPYRFVPYRNSLLTMVLKDSLGGNCLTAMIATISMESENLGESISTCRFAQRVARIANNARRNEEVDDKTLIKRLKHKVANLEHQVALLRSKGRNNSVIADEEILTVLSDEDRTNCARIMEGFLQGVIDDPVDAGIYDQSRFRECLHLLKCHYLHSVARSSQFQMSQQQQQQHPQLRQVTGDQSDESSVQMQPNNPHRDSGDHVVPEAPQRDASMRENQQPCHSSTSVTGCEDYYTLNEDSVAGAASLFQTPSVKAQNSDKKGSEIDQQELSYGGSSYRYDKQRSKELKKLGQKLTSLEQEQADKQDQLEQMKQNTLMQELLAAENNLRLKMQGVDEQVADQHAYILHLKHMQADEVQVAKEQSVGQHLLKRRAKFHDKLCKLLENKAELERTLLSKRDTNSIICGACSRVALDDRLYEMKQGKDSAQTRQAYDSPNSEEQQLNPAKFDQEKFILKSKQVSLKEASTLDRLRELKQRLWSTQQQQQEEEDSQAGRNSGQHACQNYQITVSSSIDSDHSLRDHSFLYISSHPSSSSAANKESQHDHIWAHSLKGSSRTGLHPAECDHMASDQQVKLVQECQAPGNRDRHASDIRQSRYSGPVKQGEAAVKTENYSIYMSPYQQELYIPVLRAEDNANKVSVQGAVNESPQQNGIGPTEVRSFHDPHHSHKFALDDRLAVEGGTSFNSPTTEVADGFSNKNNSYIRFMKSHKCCCHKINFNTNANSDNLEQHESKKDDKQQPASCLDHQKQTYASNKSSSNLNDYSSNCAPKTTSLKMEPTFHDLEGSQIKNLKDSAQTEAEYQEPMKLEKNNKRPLHDLRYICNSTPSVTAKYSDEKVEECVKPSSISPRYVAQPGPSAASLPAMNSDTNVTDYDMPQKAVDSTPHRTFESVLYHMLEPGERKIGTSPPHRLSSPMKHSLASTVLANEHQSRNNAGSTLHNLFVEDSCPKQELPGHHHAQCSCIPLQGRHSDIEYKLGNMGFSSRKMSNSLQKTLVKSRQRELVENIGNDNKIDESEADPFFGLQQVKMKIRALTPEERERTYMLAVAAEKARIANIRKARRAAEIIQRHWRAYKAE